MAAEAPIPSGPANSPEILGAFQSMLEREDAPEEAEAKPAEEAEPGEADAAAESEEAQAAEAKPDEEAEAAAEPETEPVYEVVVNGETKEVPLTELVAGYTRQADYTRKTQEIAEQRRTYEQGAAQIIQERQALAQQAGALLQELQLAYQQTQPDPARLAQLRQTDPAEYAALAEEMRQKNELLSRARALQADLEQRNLRQQIPQEIAALQSKVPAFQGDKFQATYQQVLAYAVSAGFTPEEVGSVIDHRQLTMAWKAMQWDEATRKAAKLLPKKLAKVPKVVRPGTPTEKPGQAESPLAKAMAQQRKAGGDLAASSIAFDEFLRIERDQRNR